MGERLLVLLVVLASLLVSLVLVAVKLAPALRAIHGMFGA